MLVVLLILLSVFVYVSSPLFYCLGLLGVVCGLFSWALYYSVFHTLLSLLILVLYIGAMMVLISYVSATSPNFLPLPHPILGVGGLILLTFCGWGLIPLLDQYSYTSSMVGGFSDFFFLARGSWVFIFLVFFMFLMLLVCSFLVVQKGTFRSV